MIMGFSSRNQLGTWSVHNRRLKAFFFLQITLLGLWLGTFNRRALDFFVDVGFLDCGISAMPLMLLISCSIVLIGTFLPENILYP